MNALFFWFFSIAMIGFGLAVILNRNPVASLLCFVGSIAFMSGLFVMLSAYFLAVVELLITAGAVMVLFLFVIMLINVTAAEKVPRRKVWMGGALALALGFIYVVALTLNAMPQGMVGIDSAPAPHSLSTDDLATKAQTYPGASEGFLSDLDDDTHRIGHLLFATKVGPNETTYVAPFEITSLLILVATIGVIVLCKQDEPRRSSPREDLMREAPPVGTNKETTFTR